MSLLLYTRRGCHLCQAAEDMLAAHAPPGAVQVVDVDAREADARRYGARVPVLAADGAVVMEGRFDEGTLAPLLVRLLTAPSSGPADRERRPDWRPS